MEGEKVLHVHYLAGLGKCKVRASHYHKGLKVGKGNLWWCMKRQTGDENYKI
jgi:hypothetical protein